MQAALSEDTSNLLEHVSDLKQQIADMKKSSGFQKLSKEEQQSLIFGLEKSADEISSDVQTIENKASSVKSSAAAAVKGTGTDQNQQIAYLLRNGADAIGTLSSGLGEVKNGSDHYLQSLAG